MGNEVLMVRVNAFVQASQEALVNAKRTSNSGYFVKAVGDGVLFVFSHFPDVVQWNMEFDGTLGLAATSGEPFEKRVCVHAGEIIFKPNDLAGLAVNQLCKIEKEINAGEFVLTDLAHQLALSSVYPKQCAFEDYGTVPMEGCARPVRLHRLVVIHDIAFLIDKTRKANGG